MGKVNYSPGGDNVDNSWMGPVVAAVILIALAMAAGLCWIL